MTPFGAKLRQLRGERGVTLKDMAKALGVSPAYLSALEHGKRGVPTWYMVQRIIAFFNVIWDEAEELQRLAEMSDPRVVVDTSGLEPEATELMVISRKPFAGSWEYLIDKGIFTFPPVNNWSGAALVDQNGKLIGIGSLIVGDAATSRPGVPGNLYVPVNLLKPILADLLATGRRGGPALPWLGVVTEVVRGGHLLVSRVIPDGPAERAGLTAGDIIVSVDGQYVADQSAFYKGVRQRGPAGITVPLRVLKGGEIVDLSVKSSDRMDSLKKPEGI